MSDSGSKEQLRGEINLLLSLFADEIKRDAQPIKDIYKGTSDDILQLVAEACTSFTQSHRDGKNQTVEDRALGEGLPDKEFVDTRVAILDLLGKLYPPQSMKWQEEVAKKLIDLTVDEIGLIWTKK